MTFNVVLLALSLLLLAASRRLLRRSTALNKDSHLVSQRATECLRVSNDQLALSTQLYRMARKFEHWNELTPAERDELHAEREAIHDRIVLSMVEKEVNPWFDES